MGDKRDDARGTDGENRDSTNGSSDSGHRVPSTAAEKTALEEIYGTLRETFDVDFSHYRQSTALRRLSRRMGFLKLTTYEAYLAHLRANPDEGVLLYDDLLLSITQFFRDPQIYEYLKEKICPSFVEERSLKRPVRIWVSGCSTGEEVYSLAICMNEFLASDKLKTSVQLFGTDVSPKHIETARAAIYPERIREHVSKERLERFFDKVHGGYRVTKYLREMCVFAVQDVTQDPPLSHIDLISCRNVLIYLDVSFQEVVLPLFHFALNPSGYLMLGTSETLDRYPELFRVVDPKASVFQKRDAYPRPRYRVPSVQAARKKTESDRPVPVAREVVANRCGIDEEEIDRLLLDTYVPPAVLVDSALQIRRFRGRTSPFLEPAAGNATLKLSKMAREELMPDLLITIEEAKRSQSRAHRKGVPFRWGGESFAVDLEVMPVQDEEGGETYFLILFDKKPASGLVPVPERGAREGAHDGSTLESLQRELHTVKEHLQAIIEEKDEVNQELWAANEEVQSTNEELQSVNEEMEAAKEELESTNEELLALNEELQEKNRSLAESEERFRGIVESAFDLIWEIDGRGAYTYASPRLCETLGYPLDEIVGKLPMELMSPEEAERVRRTVLENPNVAGKTIRAVENTYLRKDGTAVVFETTGIPFHDNQGALLGFRGAHRDITARRRAENAIAESEAKFRSYVESAPDGIFVADESGRYVEVNEAAAAMTGYAKSELIGMPVGDLVHPDDLPRSRAHFRFALASGRASGEMRLISKNGEPIHCIIEAVGLNEKRVLGFVKDLSSLRRAERALAETEEQLRHSEKMQAVGQLAGGIAHDFNNQLAAILGYAELLRHEVAANEILCRYADNIITGIGRASDLTAQLLAFSRKGKYLSSAVDLHRIVFEVVNLLTHSIDKKVAIRQHLSASPSYTMGDPTQLQNAVLNLALNARDAMPDGGELVIATEGVALDEAFCRDAPEALLPGKFIELQVRDTGSGIEPAILQRIFEPFFSTKETGMGTGMGLASVYGTVASHNGAVRVESEVGKGSTFRIYLPLHDIASRQAGRFDRTKRPVSEGKARILLVEDEAMLCEVAVGMLGKLGHEVTACRNGEEALDFYRREWRRVDLVILDMVMPVMGGRETFDAMRQINPDVIVLLASGYSINGEAQRIVDAGVKGFLQKPFRMADLASKISEVLE